MLYTVGPVEYENEIKKIASLQHPYFRSTEFSKTILNVEELLLELSLAEKNSKVIPLTASGSGAMEAAMVNLFDDNSKLLIVNSGVFGQRFVDIAKALGVPFDELKLEPNVSITKKDLQKYSNKKYDALLINGHETSTGVLHDLKTVGEYCKQNNMLLVVDAISTIFCDYYNMKDWNINVTILSSQKALALHPGMSFVIINEETIKKLKKPKTLYFNFKYYLEDNNLPRGQSPFTPAVGIILQLHYKLQEIKKIGLNTYINNIATIAQDFRERIQDLSFYIPSESLSNCLTPLNSNKQLNHQHIYEKLHNKYNLTILPPHPNAVIRVGHIGNIKIKNNIKLVQSIKEIL